MRRVAVAGAAALALAGAAPGRAAADADGVRQVVTARFTTAHPGALTGFALTAVYDGASTARHALVHVSDGLPPGTAVDTAGVAQCHAGDAEFTLAGAGACPPASIVGTGHVTLDLGLPGGVGQVQTAVTLVNAGSEILFVGREPRTGVALVDHGRLDGSRIEIDIPRIPGLAAEGATVLREDFTITRASRLLRTPATCPRRSRRWVLRRGHTYGDGVTQTARVSLPCRPRRVAGARAGGAGMFAR